MNVDLDTSGLPMEGRKGKLGANAMKRAAAGAHFPTLWFLTWTKTMFFDRIVCEAKQW